MSDSTRNLLFDSYVSTFSENCSVAIDLSIKILLEGLEKLIIESGNNYENANLEFKNLIETEYYELHDEIKNSVQLYLDCNWDCFKSLTLDKIKLCLDQYNDRLEGAVVQLSQTKSETNVNIPTNDSLHYKEVNLSPCDVKGDTAVLLVREPVKSGVTNTSNVLFQEPSSFQQDKKTVPEVIIKEKAKASPKQRTLTEPSRIDFDKADKDTYVEIEHMYAQNTTESQHTEPKPEPKPITKIKRKDNESTDPDYVVGGHSGKTRKAAFKSVLRLRAHSSVQKKTKSYKRKLCLTRNNYGGLTCRVCKATFTNKVSLHRHIPFHDLVKCQFCDEELERKAMGKHLRNHFSCPHCSAPFAQQRALDHHLASWCRVLRKQGKLTAPKKKKRSYVPVPKRDSYPCHKCDATFSQIRGLSGHLGNHRLEKCEYCEEQIERLSMRQHLEEHFTCSKCGKSFTTPDALDKHAEESCNVLREKDELYDVKVCTKCDLVFSSARKLAGHMNSHIEVECEICHEKMQKCNLKLHLKSVHFACAACDKGFTTQAAFDAHKALHEESLMKNEDGKSMCKTCKVTFEHSVALLKHLDQCRASSGPKLTCPHCPRTVLKKNFVRHVETIHGVPNSETKNHFCPLCPASFTYGLAHSLHIRRQHPDSIEAKRLKYTCGNCKKVMESQSESNEHANICGEKTWKCEICFKECKNKKVYTFHKLCHARKPLPCPHCGKMFKRAYDRRLHIVRRHEHADNRPYKCEYCFKGYMTNVELERHLLSHTGVSKHQCKFCHKYFNANNKMLLHINRVHLKKTKFMCDLCGARFFDYFSLENHVARHTDNKPYKCSVCEKGFSWPTGLRKHEEKQHGVFSSVKNKSTEKKTGSTEHIVIQAPNTVVHTNQIIGEDGIQYTFQSGAENVVHFELSDNLELKAHEVTAAESVEIQSVVYESQSVVKDVIVHDTSTEQEAVVYYQYPDGTIHTVPVGQPGEENEVQFVVYNT